jgi:hypothetical protein
MKCYNHSEFDGVAICRNCGKCVCHECAVDTGNGITCKGRCEEELRSTLALIENNKKTYATMKPRSHIYPLFLILIGLLFAITGHSPFIIYAGIAFVGFGILLYVSNAKYLRKLK